jgi:hypothetical protein
MLVLAGSLAACAPTTSPPNSPARAPAVGPVAPQNASAPTSEACHVAVPDGCVAQTPTFDEVMTILGARCFHCHAGDGVAADEHDFSKPDRVEADRRAILEEVATCSMPPRSPLGHGEADTLLRWASCTQHAESDGPGEAAIKVWTARVGGAPASVAVTLPRLQSTPRNAAEPHQDFE